MSLMLNDLAIEARAKCCQCGHYCAAGTFREEQAADEESAALVFTCEDCASKIFNECEHDLLPSRTGGRWCRKCGMKAQGF